MAAPTKPTDIKGGLNLVTPPMKRRGGGLQAVQNFRNDQDGGISRIDGYERFDGQAGPADAVYWNLPFDNGSVAPEVGQDLVGGTSGTTAVVLSFVVTSGAWATCDAAGVIYAVSKNGTFIDGETVISASGQGFSSGFSSGFEAAPVTNYLAAAIDQSPYMQVWQVSTDGCWGKIPPPAVLPGDKGETVSINNTNTQIAIGHVNSPYIAIYNTADWSKISGPVTIPAPTISFASGVLKYNHAGTYLALAVQEVLIIYDTSDWSVAATPAVSSVPFIQDVKWSHDDAWLAVTRTETPYIVIYNTSTWVKLADPATLPPAPADRCAFNHDSSLFVATYESGFLVYDTSTWTTITGPTIKPTASVRSCVFNKAGTRLAVSGRPTETRIWEYDTSTWNLTQSPDPVPDKDIIALDYDKDDAYLAAGYVSPKYFVYDASDLTQVAGLGTQEELATIRELQFSEN